MKTIAIIPARGGSVGIPKKALVDLCGKPLIAWSIEQALQSERVDEVWVTSDSEEILDVARQYNTITIKRPDELATDKSTIEDALKHALVCMGYKNDDNIVLLQPTSPLRKHNDIDAIIEGFEIGNLDSEFSSIFAEDSFIWKFVDFELKSINYNYENRKTRQDFEIQFIENGSIYIFKPNILFKYNNRLGGKIGTYVMDKWQVFEIDDREDLELCEYYMRKYMNDKFEMTKSI